MSKRITIAIDGYSSCGKSTLAKALSSELKYAYIDTGAMYRAATLFFHRQGIEADQGEAIEKELANCKIGFRTENGMNITLLNEEEVEDEIRSMEVSSKVSDYSAVKAIRQHLVLQQQQMGEKGGVVLDGRDIGTVVFPDAELKIFMTADPEIRAQRRYDEMVNAGKSVDLEEVKRNLEERDHLDSTRKESPLRQAPDARVLDNSYLSQEMQLEIALEWVRAAQIMS